MTNKNLATKNTTDFTVLDNGKAYISRNKAAVILGVSNQSLGTKLLVLVPNLQSNQPLIAEFLQLACTHYAFDAEQHCTGKAQQLAKQFMKAGAKAYIYHEAGYTLNAQPALPDFSNPAIAARAWVDKQKKPFN